MANLDEIDRQLLQELQAEGRITNVELARRVGLTAPPCLRRVRALEDMGVIRGYHADLEPSKLGFAIVVFAMVSLKSQAEDSLREFEAALRIAPENVEALYAVGSRLWNTGNRGRSVVLLRRFLTLRPNDERASELRRLLGEPDRS